MTYAATNSGKLCALVCESSSIRLHFCAQVQDCNTTLLRSCNLVLGVVCFVLLRNVYQLLHPVATSAVSTEMVSKHEQSPNS